MFLLVAGSGRLATPGSATVTSSARGNVSSIARAVGSSRARDGAAKSGVARPADRCGAMAIRR